MSKVIASRIKNVLPSIVHYNQTGFVKDRYIGETIRSIFDIMDFTVTENIPGLMIFIDFQKAFDSVEWDLILNCLEAFNFGLDFIHWVKTFYKNIQSCVINNGNTSDYFLLERGVRQVDPLSPYIFVLAAEALAIAVRQDVTIKGISVGGEETKLLQYFFLFFFIFINAVRLQTTIQYITTLMTTQINNLYNTTIIIHKGPKV